MGKIAFVFAGQGAQAPGMGKSLYETSGAARRVLDEAEALRPGTLSMCFEDQAGRLNETINTQPCLYAVDFACGAALREAGVEPDCLAGFSLGEWAAAAFSGMLTFEEGFRLVMKRAELMQRSADRHPGAMLAVLRLEKERVEEICAGIGEAWPVNYNCPGQIVVACALEAVDDLAAKVKEAGGRGVRLNVSGAFHSPYMREAAEGLLEAMSGRELKAPRIPLYANRTALPYDGGDASTRRETLASQAASPVRWQESVQNMIADGVTDFVELGPGTTLCGLIRKTDEGVRAMGVSDGETLGECLKQLKGDKAC